LSPARGFGELALVPLGSAPLPGAAGLPPWPQKRVATGTRPEVFWSLAWLFWADAGTTAAGTASAQRTVRASAVDRGVTARVIDPAAGAFSPV
jgi:hypothetical protein